MTQMIADSYGITRRTLVRKLMPMAEQQKGRRSIEVGPTGRTVASNLARLRKREGLTTRQLTALLEQAGRPIPASGITRMEKGERVVTADELTAFCVVFKVSPAAFLLPLKDSPRDRIEVTGAGPIPADAAWAWASNKRPLKTPTNEARTAEMEYALASLPPDAREVRQHPAGRAIEAAQDDVTRLIVRSGWSVEGSDSEFRDLLDQARTSLDRARSEVDRLGVEYDELARWRDTGEHPATRGDGGDGPSVD